MTDMIPLIALFHKIVEIGIGSAAAIFFRGIFCTVIFSVLPLQADLSRLFKEKSCEDDLMNSDE